jgi:uncharacterized protein (TIGR02118 family)
MICILAIYPNRAGSRFDSVYYRDSHAPFALRLLTPHGLVGLRISEGVAGLDGSPPPFWMVSNMRFTSREAFDRAMQTCGAALFADAPNYTDVEPILQLSATGVDLEPHAPLESAHHA